MALWNFLRGFGGNSAAVVSIFNAFAHFLTWFIKFEDSVTHESLRIQVKFDA